MANKIAVILNEELEQLQEDIIQRHEQAGQVATGKTIASYSHYLTGDFSGALEGAPYVGVLERGRGPAKSGSGDAKEDFIEGLKEWILARGLDYGGDIEGLERLAKFFRWWLNQFGNKMYRNNETEDIFSTPIEEFNNRLSNRISIYFESEITNEIFKR